MLSSVIFNANDFNVELKEYNDKLKKFNNITVDKLTEETKNKKLRELNRDLINNNFNRVISKLLSNINTDQTGIEQARLEDLKKIFSGIIISHIYQLQIVKIYHLSATNIESIFESMLADFARQYDLTITEQSKLFPLLKPICELTHQHVYKVELFDQLDLLQKPQIIEKELGSLGFQMEGEIDESILDDIRQNITCDFDIEKQRNKILEYAEKNGMDCKIASPQTFTFSVKHKPSTIIVKVNSEAELQKFIKQVNTISQNSEKPIRTTVIGGGRGGDNNSYSIGNLWDGTDVFIQLGWEPSIKETVIPESKIDEKNEATFRISPNIMLVELNKKLYDAGFHCPTLCGCLPFMSFAGGLSTNSHTSVGYLADIVQGIELLLPNGEKKYYKKGDKDFDLVCGSPTLGLLGVITAIDIKVKKGKKKLKRTVKFSNYKDLMQDIKTDLRAGESLHSRGVIFSTPRLAMDTPVKITSWEWVDGATKPSRNVGTTVADSSLTATRLVPWLAEKGPQTLSRIFEKATMSKSQAGTVVAEAHEIMGPEATLAGAITEMGLFFDYSDKNMDEFLKRLYNLLESQRAQDKFPINMAVFIRFPDKPAKAINPGEGTSRVAIDFVSMGVALKGLQPVVAELMSFLKSEGIKSSAHYGKSHGVNVNKQNGWMDLTTKYEKFYEENNLNLCLLKRKLEGLEQPHHSTTSAKKKTNPKPRRSDVEICNSYRDCCQDYEARLKGDIDELLKEPKHNLNKNYLTQSLDSNNTFEIISRSQTPFFTTDNKKKFIFVRETNELFYSDGEQIEKIKLKNIHKFKQSLDSIPKDRNGDFTLTADQVYTLITANSNASRKLKKTINKYHIITSLKKHLTSEKNPADKIESFHREFDEQRKKLIAHRDSTTLKWLGVVAATAAGLGVFSYWTGKAAYNRFFATSAEKSFIQPIEKIRKQKYKQRM